MFVKWLLLCLISIEINRARVVAWKTCKDTFCARLRQSPNGIVQKYYIDTDFIINNETIAEATLKTDLPSGAKKLLLQLSILNDNIVHVFIEEEEDQETSKKRFRPTAALTEGSLTRTKISVKNEVEHSTVTYGDQFKIVITKKSLNIKIYRGDQLFSEINPNENFVFETEKGTEIAMGIKLNDVQRAYGIPEHAEHLALQSTKRDDAPYRHYNVDYGHYRLESRESLYGSIGVLYGHGTSHSCGVFWLNAAQTWIDLEISPNNVDAFFMSESGTVDMFILSGPTLPEAVKQYARLTGTAPLPQYFTLGYHQSRYSYMTQTDVLEVSNKFDAFEMPVDVLWLDIDYTDQIKYFTWDTTRFPRPKELIDSLAAKNRKLVAIIDPHIKVDDNYTVHKEATAKGYYIKHKNGNDDFVGKCWPGNSSYLDFLNPDALTYYSSLYSDNHFENPTVHVWNDMNEPAVFEAPDHDNSAPPDTLHYNGVKHKDVHNIYGFYQAMGTKTGLLKVKPSLRPFVLTRSHFAGIQRYATIWTGDNAATWEYLQMSFPMCLTEALAGVSFCGADVGGFFKIPEDELYQRWYQAGAWLPFYRGHSTIDVPRREPYLFNDAVQNRVKTALYQRYAHIPVWYTAFYEHEQTGEPVIRPITYNYPEHADALSIENQILLGTDILVAPVLHKGVLRKKVYFPGGEQQLWFNIDDGYRPFNGTGFQLIDVDLDSVPVFYRAGSIIPRKDTKRSTTVHTHDDPFTLYINVDNEGLAKGRLYVDDYESYEYQDGHFLYVEFNLNNTIFTLSTNENNLDITAAIEEIVFVNLKTKYDLALHLVGEEQHDLNATFLEQDNVIIMTNFSLPLTEKATIEFSFSFSSSIMVQATILPLILVIMTLIQNH